ncbi:MAG: penicillin-binding protein 1A, partial [bacterium]
IEQLEEYQPSQITRIYSGDGEVLAEFFQERREVAILSRIPLHLQNAFIAAEDHRFYQHRGIDFRRILKAAWVDLRTWSRAEGASTITQQLARNLFLTPKKTILRKLMEAILAIQIERRYSKKEILQMFLNQIYFGKGIYGVGEAASFYFRKNIADLSLAESAFLAAIPRNPTYYSPLKYPGHTNQRKEVILNRMRELGFITEDEYREAKGGFINVVPSEGRARKGSAFHAPYFVEWVRQKIAEKYGYRRLLQGGLKVYTTLDLNLQKEAEEALVPYLKENNHQGALLAMDPHTGWVKALVGGRDFAESQFNRATQARRQTGSAFKLFTYTAAIDSRKFNSVSPFYDAPVFFKRARKVGKSGEIREEGQYWSPQNFEKHFWGKVYLWQMFGHSINVSSVRLLQEVGVGKVIHYAHRLGIESPLNHDLTLTLGTSGLTLLEMVRGYATIANYGIRPKPIFIQRVEDQKGRVIEENFPQGEIVLSPQTSFVMIDLLKKTIDHGTGRRVRWLGFDRPCAGKTGTVGWPAKEITDKTIDAWFIGFTPDLIAGVWVGNDDATPLGEKMTGSAVAIPIWTEFMKKALKGRPVKDFPSPSGIVFKKIDLETGLLASPQSKNTLWFAFLEDAAPQRYSSQAENLPGSIIKEISPISFFPKFKRDQAPKAKQSSLVGR